MSEHAVEVKVSIKYGKEKYSVINGNMPQYYHLEDSGRIYAYHYPQYYAWGKRKACNK